jgi:hypothetical protein
MAGFVFGKNRKEVKRNEAHRYDVDGSVGYGGDDGGHGYASVCAAPHELSAWTSGDALSWPGYSGVQKDCARGKWP